MGLLGQVSLIFCGGGSLIIIKPYCSHPEQRWMGKLGHDMGSLVQTLNLFRVLPNFVKEDLLILLENHIFVIQKAHLQSLHQNMNFMIEYFVIIFNLVV